MDEFWILVANHTCARLFASGPGGGKAILHELESLVCPQAQQPERDLLTDSPGRSHDRQGPARHAMEPRTNVRRQLGLRFARQLADRLEAGRTDNAYQRLVLVAPPDFLGLIREALSRHCRKMVVAECPKNVVLRDIPFIVEELPFTVKMALKRSSG